MKRLLPAAIGIAILLPLQAEAEPPDQSPDLQQHREGAEKVAEEQDELSADVQQLVIEQTHPKVIELLGEVENIMDEATDRLLEADTGGGTLAAQTEIIEKIHAAAKEKQRQSGSESGGAMLDMMQRMMGQGAPGDSPGQGDKPGDKPGDSAGQGQQGDSNSSNQTPTGTPGGNQGESRRVPKSSGTTSTTVPQEFRNAFDAYNRGAESIIK